MKITAIQRSLSYTLLVVDMQKGFRASQDSQTLEKARHLIEQAMRDNAAIIFIELEPEINGPTDTRLTELVEKANYAYWAIEEKCVDEYGNDGSGDALDACEQYGFNTHHFKVCGVNTNCCVVETVLGLIRLFPQTVIEIVQDACNTEFEPWAQWESFEDDIEFYGYANRFMYA